MADPLEIMEALESLAVHCRAPLMSVDDKSRWMRDWCEDLKRFPIEHIRAATSRWRQSENTKFPTPGQLLPMIRAAAGGERQTEGKAELWRWPSQEELDGLDLRERRRQYLIMAAESRSKAGPMSLSGNVPRPEWLLKAKAYRDEAQHIAGLIAKGAQKRSELSA